MDDDTATEILEATYRALCQHGYAALTVKDIAAEADRSKASIHYYYDSKEHLFTEFLDFLYERYTAKITDVDGSTPREELDSLLNTVLTDGRTTPGKEFRTAMLELKAQAPYNDAVRTQLAKFDAVLFDQLREIIAAGVETGQFDDAVDPAIAAEFLVTTITGAHTRHVATDRSIDRFNETIVRYTEAHLLTDTPAEATR
ncbi:TetR/AcrR family transcriptional regulator [Haloarcula sp. CBA1130]|uniref:TetR/AcrR family transcriptional regulator n=1 Tax=unclassified Haloarcula TaxID=2624677 RepID=UPI001245807A|nr:MULTISPECIES: TetR/AcrR family transcriptional regulator [unclassified Haloarcula]KAA9395941.1 TetR/AcrR family transcriptional regulator [Haloarcula sp. CBA1129]KAA9400129.1 TetR/AcrR family transcriptional regulator [Haloarcula sp. CBA1130]